MSVGLTMAIFGDLSGYFFGIFRDKANNIIWQYAVYMSITCSVNLFTSSCINHTVVHVNVCKVHVIWYLHHRVNSCELKGVTNNRTGPYPPAPALDHVFINLGRPAAIAGRQAYIFYRGMLLFFSPPNLGGLWADRHQTLPHVRW